MACMQQHQRELWVLTLSFLMAITGCAGDSPKPPTDTLTPSGAVNADQGQEQPASGEVQERAVKGGVFVPSQKTPSSGQFALQPFAQSVMPNAPAFGSLPGEFSIRTVKNTPLTARDGGHHSVDAVITVDSVIGLNQKFKLSSAQPDFTTIQASGGYYLSAAGTIGGDYDDTQTLQTELRTPDRDIALFRIDGPNGGGWFTIKTIGGHFLTALGGGGKATRAFHSDATNALDWESFRILKCGDLGSGYTYEISGLGFNNELGYTLAGTGRYILVRQGDGSYALQFPNRINYVTVTGGGGLASGITLESNRTQVQAWEQFKIVDQGNCTYTIQTVSGFYIGYGHRTLKSGKLNGETWVSTRISDPNGAPSINYNAKFELIMIGL
jgi:hypothetical protein